MANWDNGSPAEENAECQKCTSADSTSKQKAKRDWEWKDILTGDTPWLGSHTEADKYTHPPMSRASLWFCYHQIKTVNGNILDGKVFLPTSQTHLRGTSGGYQNNCQLNRTLSVFLSCPSPECRLSGTHWEVINTHTVYYMIWYYIWYI